VTLFVKICGVSTVEALEAAVAAGADAIGFVFHAPSRRDISPARAAVLARRLPPGVLCVAVTQHPGQPLVDQILESLAPDVWQSDAIDFDAMRLPTGIERWPVLRKRPNPPQGSRRVLFESPQSGSGERADWTTASVVARTSELILGGGLDRTNIRRAISAVRPFGVDVSSGVETAPGVKDARRIREFIVRARIAEQGMPA
jgi:phosphoribosylanthranilate isomerase